MTLDSRLDCLLFPPHLVVGTVVYYSVPWMKPINTPKVCSLMRYSFSIMSFIKQIQSLFEQSGTSSRMPSVKALDSLDLRVTPWPDQVHCLILWNCLLSSVSTSIVCFQDERRRCSLIFQKSRDSVSRWRYKKRKWVFRRFWDYHWGPSNNKPLAV